MPLSQDSTITIGFAVILLGVAFSSGALWSNNKNLEKRMKSLEDKLDNFLSQVLQFLTKK